MCTTTRARYEDGTVCSVVYGYPRCALVSQQSAGYGHNQCGYQCGYQCGVMRLPVRCNAVSGAGCELALGGSQTCNIWLPKIAAQTYKSLFMSSMSMPELSLLVSISVSISFFHVASCCCVSRTCRRINGELSDDVTSCHT